MSFATVCCKRSAATLDEQLEQRFSRTRPQGNVEEQSACARTTVARSQLVNDYPNLLMAGTRNTQQVRYRTEPSVRLCDGTVRAIETSDSGDKPGIKTRGGHRHPPMMPGNASRSCHTTAPIGRLCNRLLLGVVRRDSASD
jgi:hypothetical protein